MPKVIEAVDQPVIVATSEYPYANWKFEKFNPVQSRIMDFYDQDVNGLIAARTSAGKTVIAEMFLAQEIRKRGGKGMFLAPLRALAREKITDWTNQSYHFKDQKISICTGDYRLTKERAKELNDANLIIMTSEMLNHRSRNYKSEQNNWLLDIGTIVIDESHLLTVPGRGDHLEVGLMKFTEINPKARLVLLSATMPNVDEIADWVSYSLTKKKTFCLNSQYRPVPLTIHYEPYDDQGSYDSIEQEKINKAMDIVEWYPQDKFLVFAHTKRTGEMMKQSLLQAGIQAEFHNADLEANARINVEDRFKNDPKLRVIVATSTLAWGCYAYGTPVLMADDTVKKIEDIKINDMVYGMSKDGLKPHAVTMVGPKFAKEAFRFTLSSGESVVVSSDHKFYGATSRNIPDFYKASEFKKGDCIAVPNGIPQSEIVDSDDFGYLCGYVMGDGCKTKCGFYADGSTKEVLDIAFGSHEYHHLKVVKKIFSKLFVGFDFLKPRTDSNGVYHLVTKNRNVVKTFSCLKSGRNKHKLSFSNLPKTDKKFIKGVLQGLFDSDGGFSSHSNGCYSIEFSTISKKLASEVQQYLLFFGVRSSCGKKKMKDVIINGRFQKAKRRYIYRVRIYGKQVANYLKYVGFKNKNKNQYGEKLLLAGIKGQEKNIIPARELVKEHALANNVSLNKLCRSVNIDPYNVLKKSDLKKETIDKIINLYPLNSSLKELTLQGVRFSKIKKIERVKSQEMRDISVDGVQNYIGGGVISHNCNFPARRVVILGVHRGLSEVESHDIIQMVGRSGRLGIDPMGDAYILVPESLQHMYRAKFSKPARIESQLLGKVGDHHKVLAFHLVSEIYHGDVATTDDIHAWYRRSLAYFQSKELEDKVVDDTLNLLKNKGAIWQEDEKWTCRPIGKVSSLFYFSPFDASDLYFNFKNLFENNRENNDYFISVALGNTDTFRANVVSRVEKDEMSIFANKIRTMMPGAYLNDAAIKSSFCYYSLLSGTQTIAFSALQRNIQQDFERVSQVLQSLDGYSQFAPKGYFKNLEGRLVNGVPGHLVDLCQLPNIGKVRAKKLYENGIKSVQDISKVDSDKLRKLLNMKPDKIGEIMKEATKLNVL